MKVSLHVRERTQKKATMVMLFLKYMQIRVFKVIDHAERWQCLLPNHPSLKTQEEPPVSFSVGYGLGGNNGNWRRG